MGRQFSSFPQMSFVIFVLFSLLSTSIRDVTIRSPSQKLPRDGSEYSKFIASPHGSMSQRKLISIAGWVLSWLPPTIDVMNQPSLLRNDGVMLSADLSRFRPETNERKLLTRQCFSRYLQMASKTSRLPFPSGARTNAQTTCNQTRPSS